MASYGGDDLNGGGYNDNDDGCDNDDGEYGHDAYTRDFLASSPWCASRGGTVLPAAAQDPSSGSSGVNPSRVGFESLDLNDGAGWPEMASYAGMLRTDNDDIQRFLRRSRSRRHTQIRPHTQEEEELSKVVSRRKFLE